MKLVSYVHQGTHCLGAISDSQVIDLAEAWDAYQKGTEASTDHVDAFPDDMSALLQGNLTKSSRRKNYE